ncbi:MAG: acyl-CoA thioesterase [Deltaproteobacteria bacterium]|nr:acyl-CoA thioesterase [Deltaproteobacteria bacterium]
MTLYKLKRKVKLQDVDAAGILFFPKFLEYCHDTYFEYLDVAGLNIPQSIATGPYILPLVHAEADFKHPLKFGDEIEIRVLRAVMGKSTSFKIEYEVVLAGNEETLCCRANTVHAAIHRKTFKPLKQLPQEIKDVLKI